MGDNEMLSDRRSRRSRLTDLEWSFVFLSICCVAGCSSNRSGQIAVIPRTTGTMLWEAEHGGASVAGKKTGHSIYWNAPTREDDISGQIALVEQAVRNNAEGLVLAPDQELALMTPVRRAMDHGVYTVIVGSPMTIPASDRLSYILNDEEEGGRIAAHARRRSMIGMAKGICCHDLGIDPDISGSHHARAQ